ncbi:hypothetical protein PV04_05495 [Phialophora macrospora]|uniref:DUF1917 domain-containing protein n=1 Tax=Phialophora macrospora TaxID=1851006 RepID=A0A0D2E5K2_9EURO|nr:hypothetical protein PV04_05495 [Phialophora macrospora]
MVDCSFTMARQKPIAATTVSTASSTTSPDDDVSIPDDLFSEESDYHGSSETKALYRQLDESFDVEKYWAIHDWNAQVIAAKGRKALAKAAELRLKEKAKKESEAALKKHESDNEQTEKPESTIKDEEDPDIEMMDLTASTIESPPGEEPPPKQQNYYEGHPSAKQLDESVSDFLARLPPSTTTAAHAQDHWIWICNPSPRALSTGTRTRAPEDLATFKQLGTRLLEGFLARKTDLETANPGKQPGAITRMLRSDRTTLESSLRDLAQSHGVTSGKWMLFPHEGQVDRVWETVARAVWAGTLGSSAKVEVSGSDDGDGDDGGSSGEPQSSARDVVRGNGPQRLICIYTADFSDLADVRRILGAIKDLGLLDGEAGTTAALAPPPRRTIYYKCDAYTYLDISSGNEYKLRASMYSSRDLFPEWYHSEGEGKREGGRGGGAFRRRS